MVTIYEFYSKLKKHIGQGGAVFRKFCGLSSSAPYCNAYVCYGFYENGVAGLYYGGKKVTYCPTSIKWCQANLAQVPMYLAMKDDPIYFDWNNNNVPDHIGFVKEPISTEKIATHEGNTNGGIVAEKTRPAKYVLGIFRPHFKPSSLPTGTECKTDGVFGYDSIYFLQKALGIKADGILGKATVKALQKKVGCDPDGAWGKSTSKAVQKMVGATADGAFGKNSVIALQKWINKQNGSISEPTETKNEPTTYKGTFPTLPTAVEKEAVRLAYAYKTAKSTYLYEGGKPKESYKEALAKVFPNKSGWSKQCKAGASCDVFAGTVIRSCGENKDMPRGLSEQHPFLKKHFNSVSSFRSGDIMTRANHIAIACSMKGTMFMLNAHHNSMGGTYGITQTKSGSFTKYYRPKKTSYFSKGDTFTQVKYLQEFLNWYGGYGLTVDMYFGSKTEEAVKDFQSKEGLTVDGAFGSVCLAKAKAVKK